MADESSEKVPQIKVSSAYPGEWYIVEVEGGDGAMSMELRRPVGQDDSDVFHLRVAAPSHYFNVQSTKAGGAAHTHEGVESAHLTFTGPSTAWPDFVRCIQALASVFDTLSTAPLDREKVREHFFKRKK
ncbi:MAG TPA: hypothetical protein VKJ47_21240 [Candidatus Binatia bacterium]|nr:hypothetical protein [Candidatus Binatia bacterium]